MKALLIILFAIGLSACKPPKETTVKESTPPTKTVENQASVVSEGAQTQGEIYNRENLAQQPDTFRLVVSFISIGAGTDPEAPELLSNYISAYTEKTGKRISFAMMPWGREGETDQCFTLKELTAGEQADFIKGIRSTMANHDLVQIVEMMKNRLKR
ncbi:hypothetical protein BH11BAC2_BH11BAC2_26450 [soil metagenome]